MKSWSDLKIDVPTSGGAERFTVCPSQEPMRHAKNGAGHAREDMSVLAYPRLQATIDITAIGSIVSHTKDRLWVNYDSLFTRWQTSRCEIKPGKLLRINMFAHEIRFGIPLFLMRSRLFAITLMAIVEEVVR